MLHRHLGHESEVSNAAIRFRKVEFCQNPVTRTCQLSGYVIVG